MTSVDLTIVATALPTIHKSLRASINWVGWTITIYGLFTVIALPVAGKLSIELGRRRVFLYGIGLFTTASLACGFATEIYMLIVFRALQAIGGGALQPSAAGLIADHFGKNRDRGIAMFGTVASSGQIVGPILGGLLVGYLSWRWIFFVNIPLGFGLFCVTLRGIPESPPRVSEKTDVRGLLLTATFVLTAIFGITSLGSGHTSIDDPSFLVPEAAAITLLLLFIRHTRRTPAPFIPIRLLTGKGFAVMNTLNLLQGAMTFGVASLIPLYAEQRYHLAALSAGTLLTSRAVGAVLSGAIAVLALRRTGYRLPMVVGLSVVVLGTLLMSIAPRWGTGPFLWLSLCVAIIGLGIGAINPAASNASMQLAPELVTAITGLRSMFLNLGVVISVSVVTAILNRSANPGIAEAHVFWFVCAIIVVVMLPLIISRVPEHKGTW